MTVRDRIEHIIGSRREKGEALRGRKAAMQELRAGLKESCSVLAAQTKNIKDEKMRAQYTALISRVDAREVLKGMDRLIRQMDDGIRRFERGYLSVATVGKERQGKSQFLQSVGALDNSIIPAYDATSCTGATSVIWNDPEVPKGTVRATITFRQQEELLEIVKPYIKELDPEYLNANHLSFDDIGYINLSLLSMNMEPGNANQSTALKHLTGIVEHFDEIRELFGMSSITLTDPEQIKTYVAQNNGKDINDPGVEYYYKYLAVARADIRCPFFTDVGRVRLVDTVGIGDTKYGIEDMMLNTVDRECDAAIVVTRPISGIQTGDQELYNSLRDKFKLRDTEKWLFYLANHYRGQNDNTVEAFCSDIQKSRWAVADCRVVDASDPIAVRDKFLMPMLQILVKNMDQIDDAYLREVDEREQELKEEVRRFLEGLPQMKTVNTNGLLGKEAYEKGKKCFNRMTADLSQAVYRWSLEREKPNSALWNSVQAILNNLDPIIPTAEKIDAISQSNGALTGEGVWEMVLHHVRNEITDRFIAIDNVLEKETRDFKNSLVRTLYHELRQLSTEGESGSAEDESCDMVEWLKTMMDGILSDSGPYAQIRKGFDFLYRFEFNTRAQLIQEVRRQMYIINPVCVEYAKPAITFQKVNCGKAVHFYLTSRMSVIEDELRYHLAKLYRTPNLAFYAAAEEFYDRLTFASDLTGDEFVSMSDVWGTFFQEYSSRLWKEDSERFDAVNQLIERFNAMTAMLEAYLGKTQPEQGGSAT